MRKPYKFVTVYVNLDSGKYRIKLTKKGNRGMMHSIGRAWVAIPLKTLEKLVELGNWHNTRDECRRCCW